MQGNRIVACAATVLCIVLNFGQIFGNPLDSQESAQLDAVSDTKPLDSENDHGALSVWHWPETAPVLQQETVSQNQPGSIGPQSSSENGTKTDSESFNKYNTGIGPIQDEIQPTIKEIPNQPNAVQTSHQNVTLGKPAASQPHPSGQDVENVIQPVEQVPKNPAIVPQAGEPTVPPTIRSSPTVVAGSTKASDAANPNHNSSLPQSAITPWYVATPETAGASPDLQQTSSGNSSSTIVQPAIYLSLSCYLVSQFLLR